MTLNQQIPWDFPRWEWAAQDAFGVWCLFTEMPERKFTGWKGHDLVQVIPENLAPPFRQNWESTLTKRETYHE